MNEKKLPLALKRVPTKYDIELLKELIPLNIFEQEVVEDIKRKFGYHCKINDAAEFLGVSKREVREAIDCDVLVYLNPGIRKTKIISLSLLNFFREKEQEEY